MARTPVVDAPWTWHVRLGGVSKIEAGHTAESRSLTQGAPWNTPGGEELEEMSGVNKV